MNLAPSGGPRAWCDHEQGDAMLVARKADRWPEPIVPGEYRFAPADLDALATGFVPDPLASEKHCGMRCDGGAFLLARRFAVLPHEEGWYEYYVDEFAHRPGESFRVRGWAVDAATKAPLAGILLELNGFFFWPDYGGERPDIDAIWPGCGPSAFSFSFASASGDVQDIRVTLRFISSDTRQSYVRVVTGVGR
jgi:hypothetical protein